jgi:thioredoxin-like negative regulator of GroEL
MPPRPGTLIRVSLMVFAFAFSAFAADEFYEEKLRAGIADLQANRLPQAADELRIAAFGFLNYPPQLSEALARLAVAQAGLGQTADLARTIDRFLEVERRFSPYETVQLEPAVRSKFEDIVLKQVPRATLASLPGLSKLANREFQRIAALPASQRTSAYEAGFRADPKNVDWPIALTREAAAREHADDVLRWGSKVLELDAQNKEVRPLLAHARASKRECREALAIIKDIDLQQFPDAYADQAVCFAEMSRWKEAETALASVPAKLKQRMDVRRATQLTTRALDEAKRAEAARLAASRPTPRPATPAPASTANAGTATRSTPTVPQSSSVTPSRAPEVIEAARKLVRDGKYGEAVQRLRPAVISEPENRNLRLTMLEASVLARDWRTAASQVGSVTPLTTGEELYMFYASVALYETGRHDEAKSFMEKARPRMVPSPLVDYYVKAVLGQQRGS